MIVFKDFFFSSLCLPWVADIAVSREEKRKKTEAREEEEEEEEEEEREREVILLKDICRGSF